MSRALRQPKPRKRCPSCGAFNASDAAMCEMCGHLFSDAPAATRAKPAPPPRLEEEEERAEERPEPGGALLPRRPPNLPYWRPQPKPASRLRQRLGAVAGAVVLLLTALVGILLVINGLSQMREEVVAPAPQSLPSPTFAAPARADETAFPNAPSTDERAATATPMPTPSATPTLAPTPEPTRPPRQTYVVQPGDSCFAIAARFSVQVSDLIAWNNLPDNCLIRVGQELFISPP